MTLRIGLLFFVIFGSLSSHAVAAGDAAHPKHEHWHFEGPFGMFDFASIQRGYQVYKEVCASCHSMERLSFRNLGKIGFSEAEIKAIAAEYNVMDGPDDAGDMYERKGRPADSFPLAFPNQKAARAANLGAFPPDLSLIVKARPNGANYIHSLLTGYTEPPVEVAMGEGMSYNPYFPNGQIAMAPPLSEGLVEYQDGTVSSVEQMSKDVVYFLQWAAEPEMEQRKRMGIKVIIFMILFTILFYMAKKSIWARLDNE